MKKIIFSGIMILIILLICYHNIGWYNGDALEYIKEIYQENNEIIVDGDLVEKGKDQEGEYIIYKIVNNQGNELIVRLNVKFHRYINKLGPDFKIISISEQ